MGLIEEHLKFSKLFIYRNLFHRATIFSFSVMDKSPYIQYLKINRVTVFFFKNNDFINVKSTGLVSFILRESTDIHIFYIIFTSDKISGSNINKHGKGK